MDRSVLAIEARLGVTTFFGRSIAMPIQLTCPNGHRLTAKDSNAGKTGKCPVCKAAVTIPALAESAMTDSSVVRLLGLTGGATKPGNASGDAAAAAKSRPPLVTQPHMKQCPNCERDIELGYHICPYCKTYITGLNDF